MHGNKCNWHGQGCCGHEGRSFLTKEEKIEMLNEHKDFLEKEAKGVSEKIAHIKNGK